MKYIILMSILGTALTGVCLSELLPEGQWIYLAGLMLGTFILTTVFWMEVPREEG